MSQSQATTTVDSVDTPVTEQIWTRSQVMERFQINSVNTLKRWCKVCSVTYAKEFDPAAIAKLQHLDDHVRGKNMSMTEYEQLLADPQQQQPQPNQSHGYYAQAAGADGQQFAHIVKERYSGTIDRIARPVAQAFWQALDGKVLQEVVAIAETEQKTLTTLETKTVPFLSGGCELFLPAAD